MISTDLNDHGGLLRCGKCGLQQPLGDANARTFGGLGWPEHCGETMIWVTQRQLDDGIKLTINGQPVSGGNVKITRTQR